MERRYMPRLIITLLVVLLASTGSINRINTETTKVVDVAADIRDELRELLLTYWDITLQPRGGNLDVAEIHTDQGLCASPVIVQLPAKWVSAFAEAESLEYLATLISEAVSTDTTTQLMELRVAGDWLHRPVLKVVRR